MRTQSRSYRLQTEFIAYQYALLEEQRDFDFKVPQDARVPVEVFYMMHGKFPTVRTLLLHSYDLYE